MRAERFFHPLRFLRGYRTLIYRGDRREELLGLCISEDITLISTDLAEEGLYICCSFFSSFRLIKKARAHSLELEVISSRGLPSLLLRYRKRYGAALGLLLSALLIFFSGSIVWDVRVDGESRLSEREVIASLEECGLSVGTRRRSIDIDALENRVLIYSDEISWISVNIIGTVAEVEIREVQFPEESEGERYAASNIVAARPGKIVSFENISGNISATIGELVSEGQLLIGGVYGDDENSFRYKRAEGKVLAEVERELEIEIPRTEQKKIYSERSLYEKYLIFFKKRIKFFSNYRNLPTTCDKIDIEELWSAPNHKELPFGMATVRYAEYSYESVTYSDEELLSLGYSRLDALLLAELGEAELLSKQIETELLEDSLVIRCRIRCIENIASEQEIKIDGLP